VPYLLADCERGTEQGDREALVWDEIMNPDGTLVE
jgi:hypothetical protein